MRNSTWVSTNQEKEQCAQWTKFEVMIDTEKEECRSEIEQHLARNTVAQVPKASDKQRANNEKTHYVCDV